MVEPPRPAVCIVRHNYYPDQHVRRDAEALVQAGCDVSVVVLRRPTQSAQETLNGVAVHRLPVEHHRGSAFRYLWEYTAFAVLAFVKVATLHARKHFRVVEVDNMPDILVFSALIAKLTGARVILYIFDNMPELLAYLWQVSDRHPLVRLLAWLERGSARLADRVVVTQEMPRRIVTGRGVPSEKVSVVLNCADDAIFYPRPRDRQDATFEIVTHGVILERYGHQVLIDALPQIAAAVPEARVQIFGEGEYRGALEERARRVGVADKVQFRGFVPVEELVDALARADVGYVGVLNDLVLPSKLMEYVALGVPVVISRWPTFEYYFPDDAVTYFAAGSADDLAAAIVAIDRDRERARARAGRATELYQGYRWAVQRGVYLSLYAELQALPKGRRSHESPSAHVVSQDAGGAPSGKVGAFPDSLRRQD